MISRAVNSSQVLKKHNAVAAAATFYSGEKKA